MLYVFHVDCGRMMKFDMNMALSRVENLKHMIERLHGYAATHQVLLVSGGEMLQPGSMVCSYSAGTDTNPIYMFTTEDPVDSKNNKIPWPSIEPIIVDVDLKDQVERCLALPATYSTVVQRAQLAQQIFDLAREEETICERLVHEQHLQQQGWSAVIANMEDLVSDFRERNKHFNEAFVSYTEQRSALCDALKTFETDIEVLDRIPVLPTLLKAVEYDSHGFDEISENDVFVGEIKSKEETGHQAANVGEYNKQEAVEEKNTIERAGQDSALESNADSKISLTNQISLLQWMSLKDNHPTLRTMSEELQRGMDMLDDRKVQLLKSDISSVMKMAEQEEIKEIKGLEDRLCGLEKLMFDLRKIVQEQRELATAFQQNQNRASNLGDPSILPDLCASHRSQLLVMLQSQRTIRDIRRRISKAKEELADNLYKRLKYIVHIENTMLELANNLLFYHRCLRRIDSHVSVIRQIHEAPIVYVTAVIEVVRRRLYSTAFSSWASSLACDLLNIYRDEITRRQEFDSLFRGHFLNTLFPGLTDMPPDFATEVPPVFDECLPRLTKCDVETLSTFLPDITSKLTPTCMKPVIEFFNSRSGNKSTQERNSLSGKLQSIGGVHLLPRPIDIYSHLKDGFESETDTEEFEKVEQSPNERKLSMTKTTTVTIATSTSLLQVETMAISTATDPIQTQNVETLTEENLGTTTLEVERLKGLLKVMSKLSLDAINVLRAQFKAIKSETCGQRTAMEIELLKLSETWSTLKDNFVKEADEIEKLRAKHSSEIKKLTSSLNAKEVEIDELKTINLELENKFTMASAEFETRQTGLKDQLDTLHAKIIELEQKLDNSEQEKERAVAECREKIIHKHKTEIESLRCRFKLMTNMERSPSDMSLEKIERPDVIDIGSHESILQQLREDFESEKVNAIEVAIEKERSRWQQEQAQDITAELYPPGFDTLTYQKIIDEKEIQLDTLRERNQIFSQENVNLKLKIEALANEEESDRSFLKDQIDVLNRDKTRIEQELNAEKLRRMEMETSVATLKLSSTRELEPVTGTRSKTSTTSQLPQRPGVQIESCNKGDIVFVVWSNKHCQFIVVQESSTLYFLHGDSYSALNLKPPTSEFPDSYFCSGRVIDKEYCHARKDENRYRVSKGTKFYRVKLQPVIKSETIRHNRRERNESTSSASSVVVSRSTSTQHLIDSFAQTDSSGISSALGIGRDMTDSSDTRDRTTSFTEDSEEPISLLSDRYRCTSFSEEDERTLEAGTDAATAVTTSTTSSTTNLTKSQNTTFGGIAIFTIIEPFLSPLSMDA